MGLRLLRSSIAMIPQEPVLIEGSVRENLDAFGRHSDEALLQAISKVGLGNSSTLGHGATVEGAEQDKEASGASPGESSLFSRQLIAFSRAPLGDTRRQLVFLCHCVRACTARPRAPERIKGNIKCRCGSLRNCRPA